MVKLSRPGYMSSSLNRVFLVAQQAKAEIASCQCCLISELAAPLLIYNMLNKKLQVILKKSSSNRRSLERSMMV